MTTASVTSFAAGVAAAALAFGLLLFGNGTAATCALAAIAMLGFSSIPLRAAALAAGGAAGLSLALLVLPGSGVDGVITLAVAAGVVAACGATRAPAETRTLPSSSTHAARAFAAALAASAALTPGVSAALRICGADARSLVYGATPLLALMALGAAITRFVSVRHAMAARVAAPVAAIAAAVLIGFVIPGFDEILATANRIHKPSASRLAWLFGISLQVVVTHGLAAFALGSLFERTNSIANSSLARIATGLGIALGVFVATETTHAYPLAALLTLLSATTSQVSMRLRFVLATAGAGLGSWLATTDIRATATSFSLDDPIALYAGDDASRPPAGPNGRPLLARDPPGWPFQSDTLASLLDLARRRDPTGPIALYGREAAVIAASRADRALGVAAREDFAAGLDLQAVIVLPSVFSERLTYLTLLDDLLERSIASLTTGGALYVACDLAEVNLDAVGLIVDSALRAGANARVLAHGRHAIVVASREESATANDQTLAVIARAPLPALVLGAADAAEFARDAASRQPRHEPLIFGDGRTRLPHGSPRLAAKSVRALLRLTRFTVASASAETRIRLELAAAILDDAFEEEDRLLRLLGTIAPDESARLRIQRERARARVVRFLIDHREFEDSRGKFPNAEDADLRFRLGRVMRGAGNLLAAIEEFTRVIELRPHLLEGSVALAETYLEADARGLARIHRGHRMDSRRVPFDLQPFLLGLEDPDLIARIEVARGWSQLRTALESEGDDRTSLLMEALGRFEHARDLNPANADATRLAGETLFNLGHRADAVVAARRAIVAAPLDPRGHELLARITEDEDEGQRARAAALRLAR